MSETPPSGPGHRNHARVVAAWTGTALLLAYLFFTTEREAAWAAIRQADHGRFLWTLLWAIPVTYLLDSLGVVALLHRVGVRVPFREFLRVKGASYLLNIVNYNLGLVLMAAVVKRRSDRGWGAAGSPFLLLNFLDLSVFGLLVLASLALGQSPFSDPAVQGVLWTAAIGSSLIPPTLMGFSRLKVSRGWMGRLVEHGLLEAFRRLPFRSLPLMMLARGGLVVAYAIMNQSFLLSFGAQISLLKLLVFMPILTLVALVPISVSGLGSTQVLMRSFYGPFVASTLAVTEATRAAVIDAFSTSSILATILVRAVIGLFCLPWVTRTLGSGTGEGEGW